VSGPAAAPVPVAPSPASERWLAPAVGGAAGLVYAATVAPTIPPGDGGELIACAWTLGVPHPPGYPLYTVLGWAWAHLLPIGSVAWRLNVFSAVAMAVAVGFVTAAARRAGASRGAAAAGALAFGLAFEPWRAAVGAEVFALHACVVAALLWLALRWPSTGRPPYLEALVLGLGLAHHQTVLLLMPALGYWMWVHRDRLGPAPLEATLGCAALVLVGLLPYGLLMLFGARGDALVWGNVTSFFDHSEPIYAAAAPGSGSSDARTPIVGLQEGLAHHVLRLAYGAKLGSAEGGGLHLAPRAAVALGARWLGVYGLSGLGGLWVAGLLLAPLGFWWSARREWPEPWRWIPLAGGLLLGLALFVAGGLVGTVLALGCLQGAAVVAAGRVRPQGSAAVAWCLALAAAVSGPVFLVAGANFDPSDALRRAVVARFFVMPAVPLALLAALGVRAVGERLGAAAERALAVTAVVAALVPATGLLGGPPAALRGVRCFEAFGRHLLASAPEGAVVFVRGDAPTNALDVLQYCEGARPDVAAVNQQKLNYPWGVRQVERRLGVRIPGRRYDGLEVTALGLVDANIGARRVFFFGVDPRDQVRAPDGRVVPSYELRYRLVPRGLLDEAVPLERPVDLPRLGAEGLALLEAFDWPAILRVPGDPYFVAEVQALHAAAYQRLGAFLHVGTRPDHADADRPLARRVYEAGLARFPETPVLWRSYGLLLAQTGEPDAAKPWLRRYLAANPTDPDAPGLAEAAR
jgi:hypothetical protein